jgi:hypothetical protein
VTVARITMQGAPPVPTTVVDRVAMLRIGSDGVAIIRARTQRGIDADGQTMPGYSTRRIYVSTERKGTGARLSPKGGTLSRTGRTMRFDGGYAEFKRLSRQAGVLPSGGAATGPTAEVDLTLSGEMLRSLAPESATDNEVTIQTSPRTADQAAGVSELRPFVGFSDADRVALEASASAAIADYLRRMGWR